MKRYKILVFPCGSEIGLEIHRSLRHSSHVDIIGANSILDHGRFVYEDYIEGVPFIDSPDVISALREIVASRQIDAIYPAMDKVIWKLKAHEAELGCRVIASRPDTTDICLSKTKTYGYLKDRVKVPSVYPTTGDIRKFPVFAKPDIGYGTRGVFKAENLPDLEAFLLRNGSMKHVLTEYLPGPEYTVDCFTDRRGTLRFVGPRSRDRISNGISVHTSLVQDETQEFRHFADAINHAIAFRGAWFFQVKKDLDGQLTLLEIASRLGGSSAIHRALGVNFALLSVFDAFDVDVDILANNYEVELDRALDTRFQTHFPYSVVYIDLDDTIVVNGKVNLEAVAFLYKCRNEGKTVVLITKHAEPLDSALDGYCIRQLFDQVIHLKKEDKKSTFIKGPGAIFIDDSFSERMEVSRHCGIPVFDVHMIEALL